MAPFPFRPNRPACPQTASAVPTVWLLCCLLFALLMPAGSAEAKRKVPYRPQPDLRILSITPSPLSFSLQDGPLNLAIEVEIPKDLDVATILEVSSLISSPSKRSMRFLSNRQPVGAANPPPPGQDAGPASTLKPRLAMTLTWDGTDQNQQTVEQGTYSYEVRAKLLAVGEKGLRTQMVSWPKRGTLDVK